MDTNTSSNNTTRAVDDIARDYEQAHIAWERAQTADVLRLVAGVATSEEQRAELVTLKAKAQRLQQELAAAVEAEKLEQQIACARLAAALAVPAAPAPDLGEDDDAEEEKPSDEEDPGDVPEEPGFNTPAIYLDGTALGYDALPMPEELERVQLAFPDAENGYQTDADRSAPLGWCNSAAIQLDREDDSVTMSISVGDPRGAFTFTIRRADDGALMMNFPTPAGSLLHMPLRRVRDGLYRIGK